MGPFGFDSSGIILLAWRLIALVLPMLASILAVLTNSVDLVRKCSIYWILLSLLFLFEYASVNSMEWNITEWIPYSSCVRLVVISVCLVMLLLNVVKVMGSKKQPERQKHNNFQSGTESIERKEENTAVTSKQINGEEMTENGRTEIVTPSLMQTQQECPCVVCERTFPSRSRLHAHYQSSSHKSKIKSLKKSAKDAGPSTLSTPASVLNFEETTPPKESRCSEIHPLIQQELKCDPRGFSTPYQSRRYADNQGSLHKTNLDEPESLKARDTRSSPSVQHKRSVSAPSSLRGIHKVMARCEKNLQAHYDGKKHQAKLLKQSKNGDEDRGPSPSAPSELNHGNEANKFIKESGSKSEKLTESKVQVQEQYGKSSSNDVWVPKGRDASAEGVKGRSDGDWHEKKKIQRDDLQKPKLGSRKTNSPAEEDRGLLPSPSKQTKNI